MNRTKHIIESDFPYSADLKSKFRFLLNYAVLAPSHQNTQPWIFRINASSLDVQIDPKRTLNIVDPDCRELIISCGAAVHMIEVAARYFGFSVLVTLAAEDSSNDWLARIELEDGYQPSEQDKAVFNGIKLRQTNRRWFDDSQVADSVLQQCISSAPCKNITLFFSNDKHLKTEVATLTALAVRMQFSEPWYRLELASNFASRFSLRKDGMSSYGFSAQQLPNAISKILFKSFNIGKKVSEYNKHKIQTGSPALGIFCSPQDKQDDWVNTGRVLCHTLLVLAAHGYCASFMNQTMQVASLRKKLKRVFEIDSIPQLIIRVGKAQAVSSTARRAVDDCVDKTTKK